MNCHDDSWAKIQKSITRRKYDAYEIESQAKSAHVLSPVDSWLCLWFTWGEILNDTNALVHETTDFGITAKAGLLTVITLEMAR